MMTSWVRKLAWRLQRRSREEQLTAELRFHLEEEEEEGRADGLGAEEAHRAARCELGNLALVEEDTRAAWSWTTLEQLLQDLRYAWRAIRKNPGFTALAALSLALGIGANTAIYSFMDALLMRSLPVDDPGSLVVLKWHEGQRNGTDGSVVETASGSIFDDPKGGLIAPIFPYSAFELLRQQTNVLSTVFAYRPARKVNLIVKGQALVTNGEYVSGDYFRGLGLVPAAGRFIMADDDRIGAPGVVVLSYAFAQSRFGDVASVIGQVVPVNSVPFTVIGVAPPGFFGVDPAKAPAFYLPLHADILIEPADGPVDRSARRYLDDHYYWNEMMGRLQPGITMAQAQAALRPVFGQWVAGTARNDGERKELPQLRLEDGAGGLDNLRRRYSQPFFLLLGMVGLLLAIACANIANLLLARATARKREMAVRLSLGAGRLRILRQLLTESVLLASLGGIAGIVVAIWGIRFLTLLLAAGSDTFTLHAQLNLRVLLATSALTIVTGLLFGLAPARQASRVDPMLALKETREPGSHFGLRGRFRLGRVLVVAQMAISLLLLLGAGLFVRTLSSLQSVELGFQRENILLFKLNAHQTGHREPEIIGFYRNLEQRFASLPGVSGAAITNNPLIGNGAWGWSIVPMGQQEKQQPSGHGSGFGNAAYTRILETGPGFFTTMHIPLLGGRDFDERDHAGTTPVAIVNEAWVKANLPGENPIGRQIVSYRNEKPQSMEIIGLARNTRYDDLIGEFPAIVYLPLEQNLGPPIEEATFFLRTPGSPLQYADAVREIVHQADPRIPVANLETQAAQVEHEMTAEILFARLCTAFALVALAIACVGLYGTTSYTIERRTSELGIRMALGAQRTAVLGMVLRDVFRLAVFGVLVSVPIALAASTVIKSLLFGVKPNDPPTVAAAISILLGAALAASYLPAHRASRIDPMAAVRHE